MYVLHNIYICIAQKKKMIGDRYESNDVHHTYFLTNLVDTQGSHPGTRQNPPCAIQRKFFWNTPGR